MFMAFNVSLKTASLKMSTLEHFSALIILELDFCVRHHPAMEIERGEQSTLVTF